MSALVLALTTMWIDVIEVSDAISLSSSAIEVFGKDLSAGFCDFVYPSAYLSLLLLCPLIVCYYMLERKKWTLIVSETTAAIWMLLVMYVLIKFAKNPDLLVVNAIIFEDLLQHNPLIDMEPDDADEYLANKRKIKLAIYSGQFTVRWIAFSIIAVEFIAVVVLFFKMSSLNPLNAKAGNKITYMCHCLAEFTSARAEAVPRTAASDRLPRRGHGEALRLPDDELRVVSEDHRGHPSRAGRWNCSSSGSSGTSR